MAQVNSRRTKDELQKPEFNYFIAFKVELHETDNSKIESKIKTVTSDPKGGVLSRRLLELKNDAIEIMCNDSIYDETSCSYKQHAGGRKKEAESAKDIKIKDAVSIIEILCQTRKTLLKSEILDIYNSANKPVTFFTEKELFDEIEYLEKQGIKIIDNIDNKIPFSDFQQTEKQLKTIDKENLYDMLELNISASTKEIEEASNNLYKSITKINDLKKKQSISSLCGIVKKILLLNPATRKSYDQYLLIKDDVWSEFDKRKSYGIKEITMEEYRDYTQIITSILKISVSEAEEIIAIGCKYFQLTIVGKKEGNNFLYCPYSDCGKLYTAGLKSCPHCGRPLEVICWNCKEKMPFTKDDAGCPSCGATQSGHQIYLKKCNQLENSLLKSDIDIAELQSIFLEIKNIIPSYEKKPNTTIFKKIDEYGKQIDLKIKEEETIGQKYKEDVIKIKAAMNQKKYQEAFGLVKTLKSKYGNYNEENTNKLSNEIGVNINSAQRFISQAKLYMSQNNEKLAVDFAIKGLGVCADLMEAKQILQKYPPKPVKNLIVSALNNKVHLQWEDLFPQDHVTYTIIKKIGAQSVSVDDGALVDNELNIKFYEDSNIVSATPYYYSVYVERCGVKSSIVTSQFPVTIYSDVLNISQEIVTEGIKVKWEAPQNVKNIEVWKNSGSVAPLNVGEGTKVECSNDGFMDQKVSGSQAYLIVCNYQSRNGLVKSHGIKVVYKPYQEIKKLENISIEKCDATKYTFSCDEDYIGKIGLFYSNTKLPVPLNQTLKYIDINSITKGMNRIATSMNIEGKTSFSLPQGNIFQIYPIVYNEQLFIISDPILINTMEPLKCSYTFNNGTVTVQGTPNLKAKSIIVKISNKKFPEKISDNGEKFEYNVQDFIKKGKIEIKLKTNTINYISIFAEFLEDGVRSYSEPYKMDSPIDYREEVQVYYSLEYKPVATKKYNVIINFRAEKETEIPSLLLMKGVPRPMNKNAGELCERTEPLTLKKGLFSSDYKGKIIIQVDPTATNMKYAIFISEGGQHIQLKQVNKI